MIRSINYLNRMCLGIFVGCTSYVLLGSMAYASTAVTKLPEDTPKIIIYNARDDGQGDENCQIPILKTEVDFKNNNYGCVNDQAYSFELKNVPSMTKISFLSESSCDLDDADADWIFNVITRNKNTSVPQLFLQGFKASLDIKLANPERHVILAPGLELSGGLFNRYNIEGKLSCVRIEPSTPDLSSSTGVSTQVGAAIKTAEPTGSSINTANASSYINLWGKHPDQGGDGILDCTISTWTKYTHRFQIWTDENGYSMSPTNPQKCPNDDVYAMQFVNVASGTLIYLSSEAACYKNREDNHTPDWTALLKVTNKTTTIARVEITELYEADVKIGKPLPVDMNAAGLVLVDRKYVQGNIKGKLSCIEITPPTPDLTASVK